jgi:hypothetical protein
MGGAEAQRSRCASCGASPDRRASEAAFRCDVGCQFGICGRRSSYQRALKTDAQSGMPRALDLLFVGVNQGDLAIVGT